MNNSFDLGVIVATPGALDALTNAGVSPSTLIARHHSGDWGDLSTADRRANARAVREETRIFSSYKLSTGEKIWVITEADRSSTCILLPNEY